MSLFELKVRAVVPPQGLGKDLRHNAIAEDGFDYAVKRQADHVALPATEWFCYRVAQSVGLAAPYQAVLTMPDGTRALGSRIEYGLLDLQKLPQSQVIAALAGCADRLSVAYAMDMFLGNADRHFGNFLWRNNSQGALACMAIDYSRAWWTLGWPLADLTVQPNATTNHMGILKTLGYWRMPEALFALGTISQITPGTVTSWLDAMPSEWDDPSRRAALLQWWAGSSMQAHLSKCMAFCKAP